MGDFGWEALPPASTPSSSDDAAPGLTRLGVRMPVMHVCSCGVNVGSWKGMISRLLDKLEEEAVVSTVVVPNRGGNRAISWDTVREKVLSCTACKDKGCRIKRSPRVVQLLRAQQKNDRAKMLFDAESMDVECCSELCCVEMSKKFDKAKRMLEKDPTPGYRELLDIINNPFTHDSRNII